MERGKEGREEIGEKERKGKGNRKERKGKGRKGEGKESKQKGKEKKIGKERKEQSNFKIPYYTHLYICIFQPRLHWRSLIVVLS